MIVDILFLPQLQSIESDSDSNGETAYLLFKRIERHAFNFNQLFTGQLVVVCSFKIEIEIEIVLRTQIL